MKEDRELAQYRDLMKPPESGWEDGFGAKAIVGGLFVGVIMTPASMYMQLVVGADIGPAAQWVTIILFIEVARRSFTFLSRPEVFVLYYMAGATLVSTAPGTGLLWNQFIVQSQSFQQLGLANQVPAWVAPSSQEILSQRSFFHPAWYVPIALVALAQLLGRFDNFGLGYIMYRLTSDVEKLPFPMAPVGAAGVTALADASKGADTWRWRVFSFGAMLGLAFGAVYLALPAVTAAALSEPISFFAFPWKDLTQYVEGFLYAVPLLIAFDLGLLISGMVLPFWAMVGSFIGLCLCIAFNPVLFQVGILKSWAPGLGAVRTIQSNTLDFYFSFGLGLTAAVAVVGIWHLLSRLIVKQRGSGGEVVDRKLNWGALFNPPRGRGDFPLWVAVATYVTVTACTIATAWLLLQHAHAAGMGSGVTKVLLAVFIFYGFVYTPILSYVSARMEGIVGQSVQIPFVREATFIFSGYQGAAVWFAPFPVQNYGSQTLYFRKTELTGTKIYSMVKAELFIFPVVLVTTIVFSHFIWQIGAVPSANFPFANEWWELVAYRQGLIYSSTMPGGEHGQFAQAFNWSILFAGLFLALLLYGGFAKFGLPVLLFYGVVRGLDQTSPHVIIPQFLGALIGRYYFEEKFKENWKPYIVVFFAGYACGTGLIMMLSLGVVFMSKAVFRLQY